MPTNRKRTSRGRRGAPIDPDEWAILNDEKPVNPFIILVRPGSHWRQLWAEYGTEITEKWVKKYPGTRPKHWWKYDAPRLPVEQQESWADCWFSDDLIQPRQQLSGSGVPAYTFMAVVPHWELGVPTWMEDVDHDNPPIWETQLAYLKRHKLLLPGEVSGRRRP